MVYSLQIIKGDAIIIMHPHTMEKQTKEKRDHHQTYRSKMSHSVESQQVKL